MRKELTDKFLSLFLSIKFASPVEHGCNTGWYLWEGQWLKVMLRRNDRGVMNSSESR